MIFDLLKAFDYIEITNRIVRYGCRQGLYKRELNGWRACGYGGRDTNTLVQPAI